MSDKAPGPSPLDEAEGALREALGSDTGQRRLWFTASFSVTAFVLAFAGCQVLGYRDSAVASGLVAMFAVVGAGVVPRGLTLQVGIPTGVCVIGTVPLVLISDGHPAMAAIITTVVLGLGALSQADRPVGSVAGLMSSLAFVLGLAGRSIHDVTADHALVAVAMGAVSASVCIGGLMAWRAFGAYEKSPLAMPKVPSIPGSLWHRWSSSVTSALRNWRHDPDVRLAARRLLVMVPLVAVLEAWGEPSALYALLAAFTVTQVSMRQTRNRIIAQIAGAAAACLAAVAVGLVIHGLALFAIGLLGMAIGLAFVLRNQFIAAIGTTVFALAAAGMSTSITEAAAGRFAATIAGALVGLIGTVLIRPPHPSPASAGQTDGGRRQ